MRQHQLRHCLRGSSSSHQILQIFHSSLYCTNRLCMRYVSNMIKKRNALLAIQNMESDTRMGHVRNKSKRNLPLINAYTSNCETMYVLGIRIVKLVRRSQFSINTFQNMQPYLHQWQNVYLCVENNQHVSFLSISTGILWCLWHDRQLKTKLTNGRKENEGKSFPFSSQHHPHSLRAFSICDAS